MMVFIETWLLFDEYPVETHRCVKQASLVENKIVVTQQ